MAMEKSKAAAVRAAEEKEETRGYVERDGCGEVTVAEAAGDYTLPDYQPEIRKLLAIRTEVLPAGCYTGAGRAEFAGTVQNTLFYTDADGKIAALTLPADYTFSVPLPEGGECTAIVDSMAEGATVCRLMGPRKLSLRTRVRNLLHLVQRDDVTPDVRGMGSESDRASLEIREETLESMTLAAYRCEDLSATATVTAEGIAPDTRVVFAGGRVQVFECRRSPRGCVCRGEIWVRALLAGDEGSPFALREKIPFEEEVEMPEGGERTACVAYGCVMGTEATLTPGEGEAPGSVTFDVTATLQVTAIGSTCARPVCDLYSTAYDMKCEYRTLKSRALIGSAMGSYTQSGSRPAEECDAEGATGVTDADGRMEITSVAAERGRCTVCGCVTANVILENAAEDGSLTLSPAEVKIPFRVECDLPVPAGKEARFDCHGELLSVRARLGDDTVTADAEIALALFAYEEREEQILAAAEPDRSVAVTHGGRCIYVVYPKDGDTLFSIGARYHKSRAALAEENHLPEEALAASHLPRSLFGVHHLLIED